MTKYIFIFLTLFNIVSINLHSEEKNNLFCIDDCEPQHFAWVKDNSGDWIHILNFKKAVVKTYFKSGPRSQTDYKFNLDKPPYKQTFEFPSFGLKFCSTEFSIEILEAGILCFCFCYNDEFKRGSEKYLGVCVSLMHGIKTSDDKYEYSLLRVLD